MRSSGILMHISSLPSPCGIGTLGQAAYDFANFLHRAKQEYWQILPLCPTSYGDSPYQSFSTSAGNPYFIDLDILASEGLLDRSDCAGNWGKRAGEVDYALVYLRRFKILKKAYGRFSQEGSDYQNFCRRNRGWLDDYALFMALKDRFGGVSWHEWPKAIRRRERAALKSCALELKEEIGFYKFIQFKFYSQWEKLKSYVNSLGIKIIGDIPIYVADDSVDVWVNAGLFELTADLKPRRVAGVPPDGFSEDGQLWGNPVYNWKAMEADGYRWWIDRIALAVSVYDVVRIDHFRGFDSYYSVKAGETTAKNGRWRKGPGAGLFEAVKKELGDIPIIAEDLGYLTDSVRKLLSDCGFPGMKVVEFGFYGCDSRSAYLPHNFGENCVVYAGTHDNQPIIPWYRGLSKREKRFCLDYLGCRTGIDIGYKIIRLMQRSSAMICIVQMQDYLRLGDESRMNAPSTLGCNWKWRVNPKKLTGKLADRIAEITELYGRAPL